MPGVNVEAARSTTRAALEAQVRRIVHVRSIVYLKSIDALKREPPGIPIDDSTLFVPDRPINERLCRTTLCGHFRR